MQAKVDKVGWGIRYHEDVEAQDWRSRDIFISLRSGPAEEVEKEKKLCGSGQGEQLAAGLEIKVCSSVQMQTESFVHLGRENLRRVREKRREKRSRNKRYPFTVGDSDAIPTWH